MTTIAGVYDVTPDWYPMLGPLAGVDGHLAVGFSGHGLKLAPAVGEAVADESPACPPAIDISPLRPASAPQPLHFAYGPGGEGRAGRGSLQSASGTTAGYLALEPPPEIFSGPAGKQGAARTPGGRAPRVFLGLFAHGRVLLDQRRSAGARSAKPAVIRHNEPADDIGRPLGRATAARSIAGEAGQARMAAEVPMEDLRYKMIMALNAADIGNPICEQAAEICAEIAEQYCAQLPTPPPPRRSSPPASAPRTARRPRAHEPARRARPQERR